MRIENDLAKELRSLICEYMNNNKEEFKIFVEEPGLTFEQYIAKMKLGSTYGGHPEIAAFSDMLKIKVHVYTKDMQSPDDNLELREIGESYPDTVYLLYMRYVKSPGLNHYNALIPRCIQDNASELDRKSQDLAASLLFVMSNNQVDSTYTNITENAEKQKDALDVSKDSDLSNVSIDLSNDEPVEEKEVGLLKKKKSREEKGEPKSRKGPFFLEAIKAVHETKYSETKYYTVVTMNDDLLRVNAKTADYTMLLRETEKFDFEEYLTTNTSLENLGSGRSKDMDKRITEASNELKKNLVINSKLDAKEIKETFLITDKMCKNIPRCICYLCSGFNKNGDEIYRVYNSLYEYREHVRKIHSGDMYKGVINYKYDKEVYVELECKTNQVYILMRRDAMRGGSSITSYDCNLLLGYNARLSLSSLENREFLKALLISDKPDFILLNEVGNFNTKTLRDTGYSMLNNGVKTGVIHKSCYNLFKILEYMWDEYNIIAQINSKGSNIIIYTVYLPPNDKKDELVNKLIENLRIIRQRYNNLKLILYGDFNMKRPDFELKVMNHLSPLGYKGIYKKGNNSFTRHQIVNGEVVSNYIDYFITYNLKGEEFNIKKPISNSDHWTLEYRINNNQLKDQIIPYKEIVESFSLAKGHITTISSRLIKSIEEGKREGLLGLLDELNKEYKPRVRRPKNIYVMNNRLKDFLLKGKKNRLFREMKRICKNANNEQFSLFLDTFETLKLNRCWRQYFYRLRFYTEIDRNTDILRNLVDPYTKLIITDKIEINSKVFNKYRELFGDNGYKDTHRINRNVGIINLTPNDVVNAIKEMNNDKAISWDFLHGTIFDKIIFNDDKSVNYKVAEDLTNCINDILSVDELPIQIFTARLFCLNKEASKPGNIDSIRPIAIASTIVKIIEKVVLERINKKVYSTKLVHKNQIGFMKGAGCDMNLMKFRHMCDKVKEKKGDKYVFFLDLKYAYDSVNHRLLFHKLEKTFKFDVVLINTIKLLYSNARIMVDRLSGAININRGVMQGSLISPILFNLYINDMVEDLSKSTFDTLAYADDIAVICEDKQQLDNSISIVEQWSKRNLININKKKSGIMCIKGKLLDKEHRGYPVVKDYKYLGVVITDKLKCDKHITNIASKLKAYTSRNRMLRHTKFSVRSLILIFNYFTKSRLLYGMSAFSDIGSQIRRLQSTFMSGVKGILKLPKNTSNVRLRVVLNIPSLTTHLRLKLLKDYFKFKKVFGFYPDFYKDILKREFGGIKLNSKHFDEFSEKYRLESIRMEAIDKNITLSSNYERNLKELYKSAGKKEFYLVYYFCNVGFFSARYRTKCQHCGLDNSRKHAVDECNHYAEWRLKAREELQTNGSIDEKLFELYFNYDNSDRKRLNRVSLKLIQELYMTQVKPEGGNGVREEMAQE